MCCFSRSVEEVSDTNVFAREAGDGRQFLVYSMTFRASEDLAMILPLPTPRDSPEDAVRFISLQKYGWFFHDLKKGFTPTPVVRSPTPDRMTRGGATLAVVEVGDFVASFVPSVKEFARLDERFRLPDGVWDRLPRYKEFGFAVSDRIAVRINGGDDVREVVEAHSSWISEEVLATELVFAGDGEFEGQAPTIDLDGITAFVAITRIE